MMKKSLCAAAVAVIVVAVPGAGAELKIGGYIDAGWFDMEGGGTGATGNIVQADPALQAVGSTNGSQPTQGQQTFALNEVNLDFTASLVDGVTAYASVDAIPRGGRGDIFANGGTLTLDGGYLEWKNPAGLPFTLLGGVFGSVFGVEKREVESTQRRTVSMSLLSPYTTGTVVGAGVLGNVGFITYEAAWASADPYGTLPAFTGDLNGDGVVDVAPAAVPTAPNTAAGAGAAIRLMPPSGNHGLTGLDSNNNRTVLGRIGAKPFDGLEVGLSGSIGKYARPLVTGDQERRMVGADVSYAWGPWSMRGEYASIDEDNAVHAGADDSKHRAWYVEGGWTFGALASLRRSGGLVFRYGESETEIDGNSAPGGAGRVAYDEYAQAVLGGWIDLSDGLRLRAERAWNGEDLLGGNAVESDNDVLAVSVVAAF